MFFSNKDISKYIYKIMDDVIEEEKINIKFKYIYENIDEENEYHYFFKYVNKIMKIIKYHEKDSNPKRL